jgi:tetratricopeptide (TPR) repeat protein
LGRTPSRRKNRVTPGAGALEAPRFDWRRWLLPALIFGFALSLHARAIGFGFSYLDDDQLVIDDQPFLTESSSPFKAFARAYFPGAARDHAYYRPLVTASYALDAAFGGDDPAAYHRTNVLIHATASLWLFALLLKLGYARRTAAFGALLFAAHPALTQAVSWIPGRPDTLMTWFALASAFCLARAVERGSMAYRAAHLGFWLCALWSKEAALVLPLIFVAYGRGCLGRPLRRLAEPWLVLGYAAVIAVYLIARLSALAGAGAAGVSLAGTLSNAAALMNALGKLFAPVELSVLATRLDASHWPSLVGVAVLLLAASRAWVKKERVAFAVAAFTLAMLPNLPASSELVLESRLYLPAVAIVIFAAEIFERAPLCERTKLALAAMPLLAFVALTLSYAPSFRDRTAFAEAAVRGSPRFALAHRNLGVTLHLAGDAPGAEREYRTALALDAEEPVVNNNLGVLAMARGDLASAEQHLRRELELNPTYAPAQQNLSQVLEATGRAAEARRHSAQPP